MSSLTQIYPTADNLVVNSTYAISNQPYVPVFYWVAVAIIAVVFFILCFAFPIRDQGGRISPQRIAFSLIASVVNGTAAYLSIHVSVPTSVAETISDLGAGATQLVVVQNYTVYTQYEIIILFAAFACLAFANMVYTLMQPELLIPDTEELRGGSQDESKVIAEKGGRENEQ